MKTTAKVLLSNNHKLTRTNKGVILFKYDFSNKISNNFI